MMARLEPTLPSATIWSGWRSKQNSDGRGCCNVLTVAWKHVSTCARKVFVIVCCTAIVYTPFNLHVQNGGIVGVHFSMFLFSHFQVHRLWSWVHDGHLPDFVGWPWPKFAVCSFKNHVSFWMIEESQVREVLVAWSCWSKATIYKQTIHSIFPTMVDIDRSCLVMWSFGVYLLVHGHGKNLAIETGWFSSMIPSRDPDLCPDFNIQQWQSTIILGFDGVCLRNLEDHEFQASKVQKWGHKDNPKHAFAQLGGQPGHEQNVRPRDHGMEQFRETRGQDNVCLGCQLKSQL